MSFRQSESQIYHWRGVREEWQRLIEPPASIRDKDLRRLSRTLSAILLMVLPLIVLIGMILMPIIERTSNVLRSATFLPALFASVVSVLSYSLNRSGRYRNALGIYIFVFIFSPWWVIVRNDTTEILPISILMVGGVMMASALASGPSLLYGSVILSAVSVLLVPVIVNDVGFFDIAPILSVIVNLDVIVIILDYYRNRLEQDRHSDLVATNIDLRDSVEYSDQRLDQLVNTIVAFGALDFNVRAPVGEKGDMFDALATGLNALGEELQATTISKTYLDDIIASMTDSLIVVSPDGTIQTVNNAAIRMLGFTEKELVSQPIRRIFEWESWMHMKDFGDNKVSREITTGVKEGKLINRDGQKIPVLYSCSTIRDSTNRSKGMVCVAHDISARVRTERLLQTLNNASKAIEHVYEPDEIFSTIGGEFNKLNLSCSVFMVNKERNTLFLKYHTFNLRAVQIAEDLVGIKYENFQIPFEGMDEFRDVIETRRSILVKDVIPGTRKILPDPLKKFAKQIVQALAIHRSIIAPLIVENQIIGLLDVHSGDLIESNLPLITAFANQVSAAWRKVSLLKELEISLKEKQLAEIELIKHRDHLEELVMIRTKELEEVNAELSNFAYVASHDLKAPLRAISQLSSWIVEDYSQVIDEEGRRKLVLLIERTKHMHGLIEGILQYSRVGRITEKTINVDLDRKVRDIINLLTPPDTIHIIIDKPLPIVACEPTYIAQVFQNLVSNAIRYIDKPEGYIEINFEKSNDEYLFSITDNGPGIEEKYHEKIFQMFQTLGRQKDMDSTGIGLALVKRIVEKWGGTIWVESAIGQGSTFFFTIPQP